MQLQLLDFNEMHIFDIKKLLSIDWQWEISLKSLKEKKTWNMLICENGILWKINWISNGFFFFR